MTLLLEMAVGAKVALMTAVAGKIIELDGVFHPISRAHPHAAKVVRFSGIHRVEEADRNLKEKLKDYNVMVDRVEDLTNSSATNQKRLEMKDTFYKEEVRKYSEKLVESELQRQKITSELDSLRTGADDKTRRIDSMARDRDRLLQD